MLKKSLRQIISKTPIQPDYEQLEKTIEIQQLHIKNLEKDLKRTQGIVYEFKNTEPTIHFIANQLDSTGAPLVFMDLIKDFLKKHSDIPADLHTYEPVDIKYVEEMKNAGIETIAHNRRDVELIFKQGDVVVLNTAAHATSLKNSIYEALEGGEIKKLLWYMHEDWPEIFFDEVERARIRRLIDEGKIEVFIPAIKALENHRRVYGGDGPSLKLMPFRLKLSNEYYGAREASDFNKLTFVMVGKTGEGIKGHLPILYAFLAFKEIYYDRSPKNYRDFELRFVGIEEDYLSLQILKHGKGLGEHLKCYPPLPHSKALGTIKDSNITICYSLRECLPIFVYEGMAAGHPILRNDVSGMQEQLREGENGLFMASDNYERVVETIESILNTKKISNEKLATMSAKSLEIAEKVKDNSYDLLIDSAIKAHQS